MSADFWNGILRDHANAHTTAERVTKTVASMKAEQAREYRGWTISWDYGEYSAASPNYDASWEGPEDGWVDNGERVFARTLEDLYAEVDAFLEERGQ